MRNKCIQAFTLIEIMLAMALFLLGSVSIFCLLTYSLNLHRTALDEEKVASLAESIFAELKGVDVVVGASLSDIRNQKSKHYPDYSYDISFKDLAQDAVFVDLKIYYTRYSRKEEFSFQSILYRSFPLSQSAQEPKNK